MPSVAPVVESSPAQSTRIGAVVSLALVAILALIAYVTLRSHGGGGPVPIDPARDATQDTPPASGGVTIEPIRSKDASDLSAVAHADFWKPQSTTLAPSADPAPEPTPAPSPAPVEPTRPTADEAHAEDERDRQRHEAIADELARRASEHEQALQRAAIAEARGKVRIEMFGADWCPNCRKAKAYLAESNIRYVAHDTERDARARETAHRLNPRRSIPVFTLDDEVLVGFGPRSFEAAFDRAARKRIGL